MRLSIIDQLIAGFVVVCGTLAGVGLAKMIGHESWEFWLGATLALLFTLVFTPLIYKKFRLRPLMFPRCPHCKDANRHYQFMGVDWRRDLLKCGTCHAVLEVWYDAPEEQEVSRDLASFQLLWPQSWGRWRAIKFQKIVLPKRLPTRDKSADGVLEFRA